MVITSYSREGSESSESRRPLTIIIAVNFISPRLLHSCQTPDLAGLQGQKSPHPFLAFNPESKEKSAYEKSPAALSTTGESVEYW